MKIQDLRETIKIRDRGQLTIPSSLREVLTWLKPGSIIEIVPQKKEKVELRPLVPFNKKKVRKAKTQKEIKLLWQKMRAISHAGRQIDLSQFVIKDRQRH